ncbi:MAG: hypothetical protein IPG99_19080 [Ignavibacteria bacterium]|nr:hypothetical protein [Ignavibacteria bacterium]
MNPDSDDMSLEDLIIKILDKDLGHFRRDCPYDITDRVFLIYERKYFKNIPQCVKQPGGQSEFLHCMEVQVVLEIEEYRQEK